MSSDMFNCSYICHQNSQWSRKETSSLPVTIGSRTFLLTLSPLFATRCYA